MKRLFQLFAIGLILAAALIVAGGCSDDDDSNPTESQGEPPDLPPQTSFIMPMDAFDDGASASRFQPRSQEALTVRFWLFAATQVGFGSGLTFVVMAVPVASFAAAFADLPAYDGEGWWAWEYSFSVADSLPLYTARLKGRIVADSVEWEMYISKENEYSDFLWYYGSHDLGATEGYWFLKRAPATPVTWLKIDWQQDTTEATANLTYTIVESGATYEGSSVAYGSTTAPDYDRYYTIYNSLYSVSTYVEWNSTDQSGRVMDVSYFGDSDWHCWNEALQNIDCP